MLKNPFKKKKKPGTRLPILIMVVTVSAVLMFVLSALLVTLIPNGVHRKMIRRDTTLGEAGSRCGGPMILPCGEGFVCSVTPDRWAAEEGVCIKDTRPPAIVKNQGDTCGGENERCAWGFVCQPKTDGTAPTCQPMIPGEKPFIMAVIPQAMELVSGMYQAKPGTTIPVTVRATGVTGGALYLKPSTASHTGVLPEEKVSDLTASGVQNEYRGTFKVSKHLGGELIAVMTGKDGQEITLGVTVGAQQ